MKPTQLASLLLTALLLNISLAAGLPAADPVWKPIMDGKTLSGWHKNGLGDWTVEDGAFVGRSNNESLYGHLVSDQQFQDFTVRFQFQCTSGDSGFFIRTRMEDPDKTRGLQIQVGPCGSGTGGIYESYGRGWLQQPTKEQEAFCYREGQWNEMIIAAHGPRVIVHVNGFKTADLNDDQIKREAGVLALQMHSRNVNHTVFKDVAVLEQGEIRPRRFLYDAVEVVQPQADGSLVLDAAAAMSEGPSIRYQPQWGAFGSFTDKDQIYWPVTVPSTGSYDVTLQWAADDQQAGSTFVVEVGPQTISAVVGKTGSLSSYQTASIGQLQLTAGQQRLVVRPRGPLTKTYLMNLRQMTLVPKS